MVGEPLSEGAATGDNMSDKPTKPPQTWRRRIARYAIMAAIIYVGVIVLLLAFENQMVYHPSGPDEWYPPPSSIVQDVELATADGTKIHGWWFPHRRSQQALLYFHGNAGNLSWRGEAMMLLRERLGVAVLIVDYPGFGKSGGSVGEAGCYAAGDAAYAWLTGSQKIPGDQVIIYGSSLGGGIAVDLASRNPHRALVLVKTFTTMPEVGQEVYPWLPVRWLMRNRFDSLGKLDKCRSPIFVAHGTADQTVPFVHGERLYAAAHEPKQFLAIEGWGHNSALPAEFFVQLQAFLARTAPPVAAGK
jgi:fermentation-respiration switch protein FrsA (DUF1100 family)